MRLSPRTVIAWVGIIAVVLTTVGAGLLWPGSAGETKANPDAVGNGRDTSLPEHPLEHMGIAKLTESQGMPEDAITEEEAIDLVREATWGQYRDFYVDKHPAWAVPATFDAEKNTMGPAADSLPVWVVALEGWGRSGSYCGSYFGPSVGGESEDKCIKFTSTAYIVVDAVTGQEMASWHFGKRIEYER